MSLINNSATVKQQYATSDNLNTRISIHDKYSTNKMGFGNWIFSNYEIKPGMKVLELGCGTGSMWLNQSSTIQTCSQLILSDFSQGMLDTAKNTLHQYNSIEYQVIDIQNIPFPDNHFDVVIANMMLYHVPDIQKGLQEVSRILKKDGTFYAATYGIHGIIEYLSECLKQYGVADNVNKTFTLQNGAEILNQVFSDVKRLDYQDSLAVTNLDDMVDYIYSLSSMTSLNQYSRKEVTATLEKYMVEGVLSVPKEYGMFVCKNIN